jgi:serine protease Do
MCAGRTSVVAKERAIHAGEPAKIIFMKTNRTLWMAALIAALALGLAYGRLGTTDVRAAEKTNARIAPKVVLNTAPVPQEGRNIPSYAPVVKRVAPSVVTIYSSKTVRRSMGVSPFDDPALRRFFGVPDDDGETPAPGGRNGRRAPRPQKEQGVGSGVIISADGYILSNHHVVDGADELRISVPGRGEEFIAKVIGTDPATDISVLKIDASNLSPVTITDSDNLQVGDVVLAVGNPFGVGQTVTMGIVSATGRSMGGIVSYEDFIQTDAAINMGNSGGALVDSEGRLVGINTAILSPSGGSIGLGFSVPINMARRVMDSLIQDGRVTRGYLGIQLGDELTSTMAKAFGLKDRSGALVNDVVPSSPADKAGVKPGDVVTELNGKKVPDSRQFRLWVSQTAPQSKVTLKIVRDGKEQRLTATLAELNPEELARGRGSNPTTPQKKSDALDGVEVTDIDRETRQRVPIPPNIRGALITAVDPDSKAAEAEVRTGDVILEIERKKVNSAQEAIEVSDKLKSDQPILLRLWSPGRNGSPGLSRYVVVEPEKPGEEK